MEHQHSLFSIKPPVKLIDPPNSSDIPNLVAKPEEISLSSNQVSKAQFSKEQSAIVNRIQNNSDLLNDPKIIFPHHSLRDGQADLVQDIKEALHNEQIILAHAPTGLGKTASALSVAVPLAKQLKKKVFFLTNRHTQHKIAIDTLKAMQSKSGESIVVSDIIGKKSMCAQEVAKLFGNDFNDYCNSLTKKGKCSYYTKVKTKKGITVEAQYLVEKLKTAIPMHTEEIQLASVHEGMCSYEIAIELAKKADVIVGDYYYLFNPIVRQNVLKKLDIELNDIILIVDEGHNLPKRISDMQTSKLTSNVLRYAQQEAQKFGFDELAINLNQIKTKFESLKALSFKTREAKVTTENFTSIINTTIDYEQLIEALDSVADELREKQKKSYCASIAEFLRNWQGKDKGFARIFREKEGKIGTFKELEYSCLDPSILSSNIFDEIYSAVIMSGTLLPLAMYADLLGLKNAKKQKYWSPFPAENRRCIIVPKTSTKYSSRSENMYSQMAKLISNYSIAIPGNVAVFFPSYYLRDQVARKILSTKKILQEERGMDKEAKEVFLKQFHSYKEKGAVLLGVTGANFAEGIDFPGDLLQGVIVVGIPLARPDLKTNETINYYDIKFGKGWDYAYTYPAINKCIQSAGRCIRSESDRGVIIYLDERFTWKKYYDCLPKEGLLVKREPIDLIK
jgi:DNA excision repair protein ERCC-2